MLTWVEINQKTLQRNIAAFRKIIGKKTKLMPVIKANAYGHGFLEIARICARNKQIDRLCVVSLDEARELIKNKLTAKPILILSYFDLDVEKIVAAARYDIAFPLFTLKQAQILNRAGERGGRKIKVHVKVDVGTSRVGVLPHEIGAFVIKIQRLRHLTIEGLWSHFSSSESSPKITREQWRRFTAVNTKLRQAGMAIPFKHIACSAAAVLYPEMLADGARIGLSLYGLYPADAVKNKISLQPVLSWRTKIIQVKTIPKNASVGYAGDYTAKRPMRLAIIPVGYADGYDRSLGNRAFVLVNGVRCPVRGRICMNLTMVDVTKSERAKAGDTVTLIGKQGRAEVTADELGNLASTINYEIVARISPHIKRIVN